MTAADQIKLFEISNRMAERDLDAVEKRFNINLERDSGEMSTDRDEAYYPQFPQSVRAEAATMSMHYELFYCLETWIRTLIAARLDEDHGSTWWDTQVPDAVQDKVQKTMQGELDAGLTTRSTEEIDYTTFGQLGEIVRANWASFDLFNSSKAFDKVMTSLNALRAPIAHCSPLAEDEVMRLRLAVRDWFRLME